MNMSPHDVTDLCYELHDGIRLGDAFGYLQGKTSRYEISLTGNELNHQLLQPSLGDLLHQTGKKLTRQQRCTISLTLASSFIQLQNTDWITSSWVKSSITFPEQTGFPDNSELNGPCVTHNLQEATIGDRNSDLTAQALSSLGITLLEMCFGSVIEDYPKRIKLPAVVETAEIKAAFDAAAAKKWVKDVTFEEGPDFAKAIEWCLSEHTTLLSTAGWRQEMFRQVVRPLYEVTRPWREAKC